MAALAPLVAVATLRRAERRRPLRPRVEPRTVRAARNLTIGAVSGLTMRLVDRPVTRRLAALVERRRWGLFQRTRLPRALAVVALDYALYHWHVALHRVPALWRFHRVHHADLDLDVTTALRFHAGELVASVLWRAAAIALLGVDRRTLDLWQNATALSVLFHHANVRLPERLERRVAWFVMTPRLHGIHHDVRPERANANLSSGLTVWDRLHGTLRGDVPQSALTIGVPGLRRPDDVTVGRLLALPFAPAGRQ